MWTSYSTYETRLDDAPSERLLGVTTTLLSQRGDEQAVALMLDVTGIAFATTDEVLKEAGVDETNWHYDAIHACIALLDVEDHLVQRFTPEVVDRVSQSLLYVLRRMSDELAGDGAHELRDVRYLIARPTLPAISADWRTALATGLNAERPSNQARRERTLPRHPVADGLTFASAEELAVYRALLRLQQRALEDRTIAILPLPGARLRAGHTWTPDFLVLGDGRALVVEVDGPHHRTVQRRADDANRDLQWQRCGLPVVRLPVEDVTDTSQLEGRLREELRRHLYPAR